MTNNRTHQKSIHPLFKPLVYAYMITYLFIKYTTDLATFKMGPIHYIIFLKRLLIALRGFYSNKVIKVNGGYRFQLYLPTFPSPSFFHALKKFDPANKDPGPITVVFSMTKACSYKCPHCYQRNDKGPDLEINLLKKVASQMQDLGVAMFDIEGGEPLLRFDRLLDLLRSFDERAELWVNTTGEGLTVERAKELKAAGLYGVMISLHTPDAQSYDQFTGVPGSFETAQKAFEIFYQEGIVTAINCCPNAEMIRTGSLEKIFELAKEWNVALVQVIHAKPSGAWLYEKDEIFESEELMQKLYEYHHSYNNGHRATKYPSILFQVMEEDRNHFGCTAGGIDRFYFNHEGEVQPCEFVNVSFGNVKEEDFLTIFKRMRANFPTPGTNWLCCTEAYSIGKCMKENEVPKTPLPRCYTEELVKSWNKGEETKLYKDMGVYKK